MRQASAPGVVTTAIDVSSIDATQRLALIQRIAQSDGFVRSPKIQTLFVDVMENALAGRDDLLTEVKIGHRVFGRPVDYSPADDTIVRSQMRLLRRKLEAFFVEEGLSEPMLITIPKGGYIPQFEFRPSVSPDLPAPPADQEAVSQAKELVRRVPWAIAAAAVGSALLAGLAGGWMLSSRSASPGQPPSTAVAQLQPHPILSHVFDHNRPTLAIVQDVSLILLNNSLRSNFSTDEVQAGDYRRRLDDPSLEKEQARLLRFIDERQYTTIADLNLTHLLARVMPGYAEQLQLVYPRHLHMRRFKESNAILIGGSLANPWTSLFHDKLKFRLIRDDPKIRRLSVQNVDPRPGEQALYQPGSYAYSVLALLPNTGGVGNVLIMAGTSTEGTEAAAELAIRPDSAKELADRLNREAGPQGFKTFQALIRSERVGGTSSSTTVLAVRVQ